MTPYERVNDRENGCTMTADERAQLAFEIRELVEEHTLTYTWLIRQLYDAGLMTDKHELSATLAGRRTGAKADDILRESVRILNRYSVLVSQSV